MITGGQSPPDADAEPAGSGRRPRNERAPRSAGEGDAPPAQRLHLGPGVELWDDSDRPQPCDEWTPRTGRAGQDRERGGSPPSIECSTDDEEDSVTISIDLQEEPETNSEPPDRMSGILSILLAVLLFVAAVVVVLVARQRIHQATLLPVTPPATLTVKAGATAALSLTPVAQATQPLVALPTATKAAASTTAAPAGASATVAVKFSPTPVVPKTQTIPALTAVATSAVTAPQATAAAKSPVPATAAVPTAGTAPATPAAPQYAWYFGEGASVPPFRTWYTVFNPGAAAAKVTVTLYPESGKTAQRTLTVAAGAQTSVPANDILPNSVFGAGVSSDQPVYVERTTLGDRDGTASTGMTPSKTWYFSEGQTGDDFTTWLLVVNPGATPAALTVTYYPVEAKPVVKTYTAPPAARLTIAAQADVAMAVMGIGIESSQPIVAEYGIYFDDQKAAYGGAGIATPSKTWYVSSGNTQPGFTARLAMFNPGAKEAIVKVTLLGSKQDPVTDLYSLEPMSKDDVVINDRADEQAVAAIVESDQPIVVQTISYYLSGGEAGPVAAYASSAVAAPATEWYLADVAPPRDTTDPYIMLFNPGATAAKVTVAYVVDGGPTVTKTYDLAASGRTTVRVNDEVKGFVVAASITSTQPIAVERVTMLRTSVGAVAATGVAAH